jgi:hypothetical protein
MRLHPSALIDNEDYIIEIKNKSNDIKHVYKGKRKVTSADNINDEGIYNSLWFTNLEIIYVNENIILKPPKLKRSTNVCYTDLQYMLFQQSGKEFKLCDAGQDEEEVTFYDCDYYETHVLPVLVTENMKNKSTKDDELISCV